MPDNVKNFPPGTIVTSEIRFILRDLGDPDFDYFVVSCGEYEKPLLAIQKGAPLSKAILDTFSNLAMEGVKFGIMISTGNAAHVMDWRSAAEKPNG